MVSNSLRLIPLLVLGGLRQPRDTMPLSAYPLKLRILTFQPILVDRWCLMHRSQWLEPLELLGQVRPPANSVPGHVRLHRLLRSRERVPPPGDQMCWLGKRHEPRQNLTPNPRTG